MIFVQLSANQEHYKLCLLEYLIKKEKKEETEYKKMESIISNYIDALIVNEVTDDCFKIIESSFQKELFYSIVDICKSIAMQTELQIKLNINKDCLHKLIK
jgi:hypothetical protein